MKVLYIGCYRDGTGWANAAINYILSLDAAGVYVVPKFVKLNEIEGQVPKRIEELEQNSDKLRKKYASLKLVEFLFSNADPGELDDIIVGAIGFGLSLAGVNPTFFKVVGNTKGEPIKSPEKFSEKGEKVGCN